MLGWTQPHCAPFRSVLAHPRLMPYYHALVGESTQTLHFGTIREMCPSATQTFCPDVDNGPSDRMSLQARATAWTTCRWYVAPDSQWFPSLA